MLLSFLSIVRAHVIARHAYDHYGDTNIWPLFKFKLRSVFGGNFDHWIRSCPNLSQK